jgi:hypothetical protein
MKIRIRGDRRARAAHLERTWRLQIVGADPYRPEEPEVSTDLEIVDATRSEREALRKAGFAIGATRRAA